MTYSDEIKAGLRKQCGHIAECDCQNAKVPEGMSAEQFFNVEAPFHWNKVDVIRMLDKWADLKVREAVAYERARQSEG